MGWASPRVLIVAATFVLDLNYCRQAGVHELCFVNSDADGKLVTHVTNTLKSQHPVERGAFCFMKREAVWWVCDRSRWHLSLCQNT